MNASRTKANKVKVLLDVFDRLGYTKDYSPPHDDDAPVVFITRSENKEQYEAELLAQQQQLAEEHKDTDTSY